MEWRSHWPSGDAWIVIGETKMPKLTTDIDDFMRRDLAFLGKTKPVLTTGAGGWR
jgi:hypothetical protein